LARLPFRMRRIAEARSTKAAWNSCHKDTETQSATVRRRRFATRATGLGWIREPHRDPAAHGSIRTGRRTDASFAPRPLRLPSRSSTFASRAKVGRVRARSLCLCLSVVKLLARP
jgi:hypothetical protein